MVDEGVAVALIAEDGVVAVDFLLADGVFVAPTQQHGHGPCLDFRLVGHGARAPPAVLAGIAHAHVEIAAGDVAFVLVDRLKHLTRIARRDTRPQFGAVARSVGGVVDLAVRIIRALPVDIAVGGIYVEEVAAGRGFLVEPALGPGVLAVPAVAFLVVSAAISAEAVLDVGVDVPNLAVGLAVGVGEGIQKASIADHSMVLDDVVEGGFQFVAVFSGSVVIVAGGNLCPQICRRKKQEQQHRAMRKMVFHNVMI